jgi:NADH-quinone oxidoreductase subunit K
MVNIQHFLMISAVLFIFGLYTVVTRRNALGILLGTELVLNAAALNIVIFGHFSNQQVGGSIYALFVIVLAAAEAAVALAVGLTLYQNFHSIDTTQTKELKG